MQSRRFAPLLQVLLIVNLTAGCARLVHAAPGPSRARAVSVYDGDTIRIASGRGTTAVRLLGVDCPERSQPFGDEARAFTSSKVLGQTVGLRFRRKDRYGRLVAEVLLEGGQSLNQLLLSSGLAWWHTQYSPNRVDFRAAQTEARRKRRGLWASHDPVPPWVYRRQQRKASSSLLQQALPLLKIIRHLWRDLLRLLDTSE